MAVTITLKKSSVADKRPLASSLVAGELALNSNSLSTGVFLLDDNSNVVKVGPIAVGPSAPNVAPAGSGGNSVGESWYDTGSSTLFVWDGFAWRSTSVATSQATPSILGTVYGCTGSNTALGLSSGANITTGTCNLTLGANTNVSSATGSCQLALGWGPTDNWLTGLSTKAIRPGAGIVDCAGTCGTYNQALFSDGNNAVCWASLDGGLY